MVWRYLENETEDVFWMLFQEPIPPLFKTIILKNFYFFSPSIEHSLHNPTIDELYHENSKLIQNSNYFQTVNRRYKSLFPFLKRDRSKSFEAYYDMEGICKPIERLDEPYKGILNIIKKCLPISIGFYCILCGEPPVLLKFEKPDYLFLVKILPFNLNEFLTKNIYLLNESEISLKEKPLVVIFLFTNHTIFRTIFGLRGYKIALFEVGKCVGSIEAEIKNLNLSCYSTSIFYDNPINRLLNLDGKRFAVHSIILIGNISESLRPNNLT